MSKHYLTISNANLEQLTIEIKSTLQVTGIMQKSIVPLAYTNNSYDTAEIMRLEAKIQTTSVTGYLTTLDDAKFVLKLESYNGLEVFTVGVPKEDGYDWEYKFSSFSTEQVATKHLINAIMERVRKETEQDV